MEIAALRLWAKAVIFIAAIGFDASIGTHARSTDAMAGLPFNNAVEVEMIVEVAEWWASWRD